MLKHPAAVGLRADFPEEVALGLGLRNEGSLGRGHGLHRCSETGVHLGALSWVALWRSAAYLAGPPGGRCGAPLTGRLSCTAPRA